MFPRCHETAGNKEKRGEKDKEIEKEETRNATKTATILWRFLLAIFDYKTVFLRFWPFLCPPIEVIAIYIYTYIYIPLFFFVQIFSSFPGEAETCIFLLFRPGTYSLAWGHDRKFLLVFGEKSAHPGVKFHKIGKTGFRGGGTPISRHTMKGRLSQKSHLYDIQGITGKIVFFDSTPLFVAWWERGVFCRNPLFPILWILTSLRGDGFLKLVCMFETI